MLRFAKALTLINDEGKREDILFFTSSIIIVFFCFAFYLIWDQFLKKDSRLSTGLQVLRKKINTLETLSIKVDDQVTRQLSILKEKTQHFESLIKKAQRINDQLDKQLKNPPLTTDARQKLNWLEIVKEKPASEKDKEQKKVIQFGQSPFKNLDSSP